MKHLILFVFSLLFFGCKNSDFSYFQKDELTFEEIKLKNNSEIRLLSYSGGDNCVDDKTYYQQFIGILTETNDTVRIFSKCFINFNPGLNQDDTIVYFMNDVSELIKKYNNKIVDQNLADGLIQINNTNSKEYLIYNDKQKSIECGNYKTAFGFVLLSQN